MKRVLGIIIFMLFFLGSLNADGLNTDGKTGKINFGGLVQTWLSHTQGETDSAYGFGIKRLEFNPYGSITDKIDWGFMVGWDNNALRLFDAYLNFQIHEKFNIKVGRFSVPGAVSGSLSPSGDLDLIERAAITMHWAGNSAIFGERAWGVQAYGDLLEGKLVYAVMFANRGAFGDSFTPSIKSAVHEYPGKGVYLWSRLEARPIDGLRIGAFYGTGEDKDTGLDRTSYGAHLFYVKKGVNLKAEYIAGKNSENNAGQFTGQLKYNGAYIVIGYKIGKFEPVARYDFTVPNDNSADMFGVEKYRNISLGVNYNFNKHIRFQLNYVVKEEDMGTGLAKPDNNIFYLNLQYTL